MTDSQETPQAPAEAPELVEIQSLDQFAAMVGGWFAQKQKQINHLITVPDGAEFTIGEGDETQSVVLTGQTLVGFKFGVEMALMVLGELPFVAQTEEAQAPAEAPKDAAN